MYTPNLNTMKKIFGLVAVVAIAALNVVVSNNNKEELSDLTLENIEACAGITWTEGPVVYVKRYHDGRTYYTYCAADYPKRCDIYMAGSAGAIYASGTKIESFSRLD